MWYSIGNSTEKFSKASIKIIYVKDIDKKFPEFKKEFAWDSVSETEFIIRDFFFACYCDIVGEIKALEEKATNLVKKINTLLAVTSKAWVGLWKI